MGRAPGPDRRAAARASRWTPSACSAPCAARSPTGGFPTRSSQIDAMPLAATGKIDKNRLRADYADGSTQRRRSTSVDGFDVLPISRDDKGA